MLSRAHVISMQVEQQPLLIWSAICGQCRQRLVLQLVCLLQGGMPLCNMPHSALGADLGVPAETKIAPELYKLLLYQEGDHFSPHRDTEKTDGMFATLTIMLSSLYQVYCILSLRLSQLFAIHS